MKLIIGLLGICSLYLLLKLAIGDVAFYKVYKIKQELHRVQVEYDAVKTSNAFLSAQLFNLKHSKDAMEELARKELSMVAENEILYYDI